MAETINVTTARCKFKIVKKKKVYLAILVFLLRIKVPLLCAMKGSYFGFGSPQQQVDMHARSQNTFIVLYYAFICEKTNMWADNMLMFHVDVNMKRLGIRFKNDSFQ